MFILNDLHKIIDFTCFICVRDKNTKQPVSQCSFYDFRATSLYQQNKHKKVKVCKTQTEKTFIIYI